MEREGDLSRVEVQGGTKRSWKSIFTIYHSTISVTSSIVNYTVYNSNDPQFERFTAISSFLHVALVF
jgi:hypothetical protein